MEKNNNTIVFGLVGVIVGLAIGYTVGISNGGSAGYPSRLSVQNGTHVMPDGSMMANGGSMDMQDMMVSMNASLNGKTGDAFDKSFLSEMIVHHEGAVEMAKSALQSAKHQEIKDLASGIISAQNKDISEMKQWQRDWYNQ